MADRLMKIKLADIHVAEDNLRTDDSTDIQNLADSIAFIGLLEPIRVAKNGEGYKIIAGHRRYQALLLNQETETQAIVHTTGFDDSDRTAAMLIENMQRVDLDITEQAEGVRRLIQEHGMSQADLAINLGVSKKWVEDRIAILNVPETATQPYGQEGQRLSVKHLALLGSLDEDRRKRLLDKAPVPSSYAIEDAWNKQMSVANAERATNKFRKEGYLICTETELKKLIKAEYATLSGDDQAIKTIIGAATSIGENYSRVEPGEVIIVLKSLHNFVAAEKSKSKVYVSKNAGGYISWYELDHRKGREPDEAVEINEVDERNEALRVDHEVACVQAEIQYLATAKASELLSSILLILVEGYIEAWRSERTIPKVLMRLGLPFEPEGEGEWITKNHDALRAYFTKSSTNLARTIAAFRMADSRKGFPGVEYPPTPEYEGWADDEDDEEDELDGI